MKADVADVALWNLGIAVSFRNREARAIEHLGSLVFRVPLKHAYLQGRGLILNERVDSVKDRQIILERRG